MQELNGNALTPLFHSEITSSYMLYDIFSSHKAITTKFIEWLFDKSPDPKHIELRRERSYPKKGTIDIFIKFNDGEKSCALLMELKVHDYLSTKTNQIMTYYQAEIDTAMHDEVYFVFLTQFTEDMKFENILQPKTIDEARKGKMFINNKFAHISWEQMHKFLESYFNELTEEQKLIVNLHNQWMMQKCKTDLEDKVVNVGDRALTHYFPDIYIDMNMILPFGEPKFENNKKIWSIDTSKLSEEQLAKILEVIRKISESKYINKLNHYETEEQTLHGVNNYIAELLQNPDSWLLASFYLRLFHFAEETSYLKFNGTGTTGFSIKLFVFDKGEISICTIYRNRKINFALLR